MQVTRIWIIKIDKLKHLPAVCTDVTLHNIPYDLLLLTFVSDSFATSGRQEDEQNTSLVVRSESKQELQQEPTDSKNVRSIEELEQTLAESNRREQDLNDRHCALEQSKEQLEQTLAESNRREQDLNDRHRALEQSKEPVSYTHLTLPTKRIV